LDVGEVGLHQLRLGVVAVLRAAHQVADQEHWVAARVGRGPFDRVGEHELALAELRVLLRLIEVVRRTLGARGHVRVANLDLGDAQALGLARVGVADGAVAGLDRLDHAGRLRCRLAAVQRPGAVGVERPDARGGHMEVVGEVGRGPRLVRAMDRRDLRAWQAHTRIVRLDGRVVPGCDLALEDLRGRVRAELQVVDALEVVDDRDRRDVVRDLNQLAGRAALRRLRHLIRVERRVAAGEGGLAAGDELVAAAARPDRVVRDRGAGVLILELGGPGLLRGLLRARAGAGQVARDAGRAAAVARSAG